MKKEFWVEYNMLEDGRPMEIRIFRDRKEADEFAKDIADAKIVEVKFR